MLNGHRLADIQQAEDSLLSVNVAHTGRRLHPWDSISCGYRKNAYTSTSSTTLATTVTIAFFGEMTSMI